MLKYIIFAILVVCGWVYWGHQKAMEAQKRAEQEALRATQSMQGDVQRAEDATAKANALIKQQEEDLKKGIKNAE